MSIDLQYPEAYIHQFLPRVLFVIPGNQVLVSELALSLSKMYDHGVDTVRAVLGDKCCSALTALKVVRAVQNGSYDLWRGVYNDASLGWEYINGVKNGIDLCDSKALQELISNKADPEEVGRKFRFVSSGKYTPYGFLVKKKHD